jgi:hypothetical protein
MGKLSIYGQIASIILPLSGNVKISLLSNNGSLLKIAINLLISLNGTIKVYDSSEKIWTIQSILRI